jgi:hypothetical protein
MQYKLEGAITACMWSRCSPAADLRSKLTTPLLLTVAHTCDYHTPITEAIINWATHAGGSGRHSLFPLNGTNPAWSGFSWHPIAKHEVPGSSRQNLIPVGRTRCFSVRSNVRLGGHIRRSIKIQLPCMLFNWSPTGCKENRRHERNLLKGSSYITYSNAYIIHYISREQKKQKITSRSPNPSTNQIADAQHAVRKLLPVYAGHLGK